VVDLDGYKVVILNSFQHPVVDPEINSGRQSNYMTKIKPIKKLLIPAAGMGTRFLPVTKAQPKEMLPVLDKPVIQYVVEEAVASGITDIIFVSGPSKRPLEDHFDRCPELEAHLAEFNKIDFNSKVVQSALNKPTFLVNNYGTFFEDKVFQSILYNYFKKLPINKGKEIAIFIEDAEIFSYFKESSMFSMIEELNQKGYFVVACFKWVFKLNPLVKRLSNHLIIIKSIYNQSSIINLIKPNKIKTTVKNLEDGQYYYLDNFRLKKEKPVEIKDLNYNSINLVPNIETITEKIIKYKIGDF